ncbi:hypothetical protein [Taibaiella koreensis]|uniref:hypothetical protein n=1 Tax=Taibaiella koreensis TaxID=1268548 RepID=UPI000E59B68B|nr:hypothetical protein [Taibaiella koreensis]
MLKRYKLLLLLLCLPVLFSSCFEIIEEISMNADGSGAMTITLNLSQSRNKVSSVLMMDSINGYKVPSRAKIKQEMDEAVARLKKMPGISNVSSKTDFNNYIASISFSFREAGNINNISREILEAQKIKTSTISTYSYNKATATFSRDYKYYTAAKTEFNKLKKEDKDVFKTATYTGIYRFSNTVMRQTNPKARISKNGKAVMQQCSVMDLINGNASVATQIQLAK